MLRKASRQGTSRPTSRGDLARERREPVGAERVAGERAAEVRAPVRATGVERVRALDVLLEEVLVVLVDGDVEPAVGDDPALLDRIGVRLGERDELALDGALGKVEAGRPANRLERSLARPLERLDEHAAARAASARGRSRRPSRSPDGSRGRR